VVVPLLAVMVLDLGAEALFVVPISVSGPKWDSLNKNPEVISFTSIG
jgi:hypothetical protein